MRDWSVYPITTRRLEVLRVSQVSPGMRRVTLGGTELTGHIAANGFPVAPFRSEGFDDEFKIILKHPDVAEPVVPTQADGVLDWPRDPNMVLRTYTVRRWDALSGEIDVDFVEHGVGPATVWARTVRPGEHVHIAGPKMSGTHPVDADWTLIAGDETALPSIARWLEEFPPDARAQVFVEIGEATHQQDLVVPPGVELTWLSREGREAGTTTLLQDAITSADWWPGETFAWIAGETLTLTPIRRWLRNEKGLTREQVEVTGYWRRSTVRVSESDPTAIEEVEENTDDRLHELTELVPPFAIRVAATIGLGPLLRDEALPLKQIATATGADATGLFKLLRYLGALGLVEQSAPDRYRWSALGAELDDEDVAAELTLDGAHARRELGVLALLSAVRTGHGDYERYFGTPFAQDAGLTRSRIERAANLASYVAEPLCSSALLDGVDTVWLVGDAAGVFARAMRRRRPGIRVRVLTTPSAESVVREQAGDVEITFGSPLEARAEPADVVVFTDGLSAHPDADAALMLRMARASAGRVLVAEENLDKSLADEHEYEDDLLHFALGGGSLRTAEEFATVVRSAGLTETTTTIGWGVSVHVIE